MESIQINNNVSIEDIYDGKTWIHGCDNCDKNDIKITIFLITICTDQLKYSLRAINNLDNNIPILINVIMNISPTNAAYNQMRIRCTTDFFVQVDEDMELNSNSISLFNKYIKQQNNNTFLYTFKLVDTILGVGNPPVIDCMKLYNNNIMSKYPTYNDGRDTISSVDQLWHKQILSDEYNICETKKIIGNHGKHRSNFDLFLRHCKIISSLMDKKIKTNNGHLCKLLKGLDTKDINKLFNVTKLHFNLFSEIDDNILNSALKSINSYVPPSCLKMYNINNRTLLENTVDNFTVEKFKLSLNFDFHQNKEYILCIVAILCVSTGNYAYSFDKYPRKIFFYFDQLTSNKIDKIIHGKLSNNIKFIENKFCYV